MGEKMKTVKCPVPVERNGKTEPCNFELMIIPDMPAMIAAIMEHAKEAHPEYSAFIGGAPLVQLVIQEMLKT